ncbi:hypothetical protein [Kitasatospora cineracea]|uniref:hypothetical protein n=1 Tax=Kitasatospora cineracea TaxID=88074 RepID=UPI0037A32B88
MTAIAESDLPAGIVGTRQLTAVQTFGIARLTSDLVALVPGTFVAVTGRGPKDSNESGKTSFLAAVALLLGDPEWQITGNGTANATSMLFEPVVAGASAQLVGAAQRGYVVGLFTDPYGQQPHTVWLQISNDQPHIQVRHQTGTHLLTDGTDIERHKAAPDFYHKLEGKPLGSSEYAHRLYGRSPKVLAYVASRGQVRSRPSLLKLEAATYSPDRIGEALITLSGRSTLLEHDTKQRRELDTKQAEYQRALEQHDAHLLREDKILEAVAVRNDLRSKVAEAKNLQQASRARAVLDASVRVYSARTLLPAVESQLAAVRASEQVLRARRDSFNNVKELEETRDTADAEHKSLNDRLVAVLAEVKVSERELKEAEEKLEGVQALAARHAGESSATLTKRIAELAEQTQQAQAGRTLAERDAVHHTEELRKAEQGQAGRAGEIIEVLEAMGIAAVGLHDRIELNGASRDHWEAVLQPWQDAVCVSEADLANALDTLNAIPGAIVVAASTTAPSRGNRGQTDGALPFDALPAGIAAAPAAVVGFLQALSVQSTWTSTPPHATLGLLGVHIVGGFPSPVVGREALCTHLRIRRDDALAEVERHASKIEKIAVRIGIAEDQLACAGAAESLPSLLQVCRLRTQQLVDLRGDVERLSKETGEAREAWSAANTAVTSRLERIKALAAEIAQICGEIEVLEAKQTELTAATSEDAFRKARFEFGGSGHEEETARLFLGWPASWQPAEPDRVLDEAPVPLAIGADSQFVERRSAADLHSSYTNMISACRTILQYRHRAHGYPTVALARAIEAGDASSGLSADAVLRALADWLADNEAADAEAEDEVAVVRQVRESEHQFIAAAVAKLTANLHTTQDVIKQRVSSALDSIGAALNRLDRAAQGFGADLDYRVDPPSDTDHAWRCTVTPRWRRNPGGQLLAYDTVTNTAQEKLFSINLVLAALLAAPNAEGRVLILDELGDSLGQEHRREVLAAISGVAAEHGITVLGTCQDTIMREVAPICGEILYFHYPSKSEYLNLPTRMFGYDENAERVELTADDLLRSFQQDDSPTR